MNQLATIHVLCFIFLCISASPIEKTDNLVGNKTVESNSKPKECKLEWQHDVEKVGICIQLRTNGLIACSNDDFYDPLNSECQQHGNGTLCHMAVPETIWIQGHCDGHGYLSCISNDRAMFGRDPSCDEGNLGKAQFSKSGKAQFLKSGTNKHLLSPRTILYAFILFYLKATFCR